MKRITTLPFYYKKNYPPYMKLNDKALSLRDEFNNIQSEDSTFFEDMPCLCGKHFSKTIALFDRYRLNQRTAICTFCGLVQSMPRMSEKTLNWFYSSDFYRQLYDADQPSSRESIVTYYQDRYSKIRHNYINSNLKREIKSVLEIGCGGGWNLYPYFKEGKKVLGFDLGPDLISKGRSLGMDLRVGKIDDVSSGTKYDLIFYTHVLEHMRDPVNILKKLSTFLEPDGVIYLEVPNFERYKKFFGDVQLQNAHLYYFTPNTFLFYSEKAGLFPVSFQVDILGPNMGGLFQRSSEKLNIEIENGKEYKRMKRLIQRRELKYRTKSFLEKLHLLSYLKKIKQNIKK